MKGYTTAGVLLCELFFIYPERNAMLRINGKDAMDAIGLSLTEYLNQRNYKPAHVVVELNEEIMQKDQYEHTILKDGDVVEILSFMGGGA